MKEDMNIVADNMQAAYSTLTNISDNTLDGISAVKSTIEVLLGEEKGAINSYNIFLKDIKTKLPKELYNAISHEIIEIIDDEKDHINILKTISANLKDTIPNNINGKPFTLANNTLEESLALYESENENTSEEDVELYMNTWANYNENGANASSISGGWMTPIEAKEWAEHMSNKGEEPFINDVNDNIGLPFEIHESANVLNVIDNIIDFTDTLTEDEQNAVHAIMEYNGDNEYDDARVIIDNGNYIFYSDVTTNAELAEAVINDEGGITNALSSSQIENYVDLEEMYDDQESDFRNMYARDNDFASIDDVDDDELKQYAMEILETELQDAIASQNSDFFESYFDYDDYGRDLSFDYTITSYGAILIM